MVGNKAFGGRKEIIQVFLTAIIILLFMMITYLKKGLSGYYPDLMYHLLRIEGLKESIKTGDFFPKIYSNFFCGFGYGSPMFYPDIILIIPALFRCSGLSVEVSYKLFVGLITIVITLSTFYSYKSIVKDINIAMLGTFLQTLSLYYMANIIDRVGLSEYLAFIFLPVLFAAIYDFFENDARKWYLFIVAFSGLLLSHLITTFLAFIITLYLFVIMLFFDKGRNAIFNIRNIWKLVKAIVAVLGITAYFLFPLLEQMFGDTKFKYMFPANSVRDGIQPLKVILSQVGHFNNIAYVGMGLPVILLLGVRFLCKTDNKWENVFLFSGLALWISSSISSIWIFLSGTFLNMIQYPYRVYSLALSMIICGGMLVLVNLSHKNELLAKGIIIVLMGICLIIALREDLFLSANDRNDISGELLQTENYYIGQGEWLPKDIEELGLFPNSGMILDNDISYERQEGTTGGAFEAPAAGSYTLPVIGYKGYEASIQTDSDNKKADLTYDRGLLQVTVDEPGRVTITYTGTFIQHISMYISMLSIILMIGLYILRSRLVSHSVRTI